MIKKFFLLGAILLAPQLLAAPGPQVAKMLQTPASAFDLFLFRLYQAGKCNTVIKNNNLDEAALCLSALSYDADKNILSAFFRVLPGAEAMDDFVDLEADGRKQIMLALLDNTVRRFGARDTWGLLHSTPLGHGLKIGGGNEKAFRAELAQRTSIALSTSYDGVVYIATRHHDGSLEYFTNK